MIERLIDISNEENECYDQKQENELKKEKKK